MYNQPSIWVCVVFISLILIYIIGKSILKRAWAKWYIYIVLYTGRVLTRRDYWMYYWFRISQKFESASCQRVTEPRKKLAAAPSNIRLRCDSTSIKYERQCVYCMLFPILNSITRIVVPFYLSLLIDFEQNKYWRNSCFHSSWWVLIDLNIVKSALKEITPWYN